MSGVFIDSVEKHKYVKTFEGETVSDIVFSRPSSGLRIFFNTTVTFFGSVFWARSWQNYKKLPLSYPLNYSKAALLYSLGYFCANEAAYGVLNNQFQLNNFFVTNLIAFAFSLSVATLRRKSFFGQNKLVGAKHGLHIFVYSTYWDLSTCHIRHMLLVGDNDKERSATTGESMPDSITQRRTEMNNVN